MAAVLGAAVTAGADFVLPEEYGRATERDFSDRTGHFSVAAQHLLLHYVTEDRDAALALATWEYEEGVRGVFLFPGDKIAGPEEQHWTTAGRALQALGHRAGMWLADLPELDADAALAASVGRTVEAMRRASVRLAAVAFEPEAAGPRDAGRGDAAVAALTSGCRDGVIPFWIYGRRVGAEQELQVSFVVDDDEGGWSLWRTSPIDRLLRVDTQRLVRDMVVPLTELAARGACVYHIGVERYR